MSKGGMSTNELLLDVKRFLYYNSSVTVTLRRNVFHSPQLKVVETLRKRGKLTAGSHRFGGTRQGQEPAYSS